MKLVSDISGAVKALRDGLAVASGEPVTVELSGHVQITLKTASGSVLLSTVVKIQEE